MGSSRAIAGLFAAANILILVLATIICLTSLGYWNDYVTSAITIIATLAWCGFVICSRDNVTLSCFAAILIVDALLLLSQAIYHSVMTAQYAQNCFHDDWNAPRPEYGCHEWRQDGYNHYKRSLTVLICFWLAFLFRLVTIGGTCLAARDAYQDS